MEGNNIILENGANFATIIALLFVGYQIYSAKKEQKMQHDKQEILKAIELAELYAQKLMNNMSYLNSIFKASKIEKYFENIKYHDLKEFDRDELKKIFKGQDINKIYNEMENINENILMKAIINMKSDLDQDELNRHLDALKVSKYFEEMNKLLDAQGEIAATDEKANKKKEKMLNEIKKQDMYYKIYCKKLYIDTLEDTLNTLEYFCMYFNSGVADEETVYQSLHQSFLSMVKLVYFKIAYINETGKDKYYTNITELYNKWSLRYQETEESEIDAKRNLVHKHKKVKR
ncbi:hypothetical protein JCM1393_25580 [Clostridium carnis]